MKTGRILAICGMTAAMSIFSIMAAAADYEDTVEKTFQVREGGTLTVASDVGGITVTTGGGNTVHVSIIREIDPPGSRDIDDILDDFDIRMEQRGNDVDVEIESNWRWNGGGFFNFFSGRGGRMNIQIEVSVPETYNVDLQTSGGGIRVDDLNGSVDCNTSGGGIRLGMIDGPVRAKTSGGGINVDGTTDDADLHTSGGGITIGDADGNVVANTSGGGIKVGRAMGNVKVHTSGGGITVEEVTGSIDASTSGGPVTAYISGQPKGDCRLTTSGGGVTVNINKDTGFHIDAHTSGGSIRASGLTVTLDEKDDDTLIADMNGGGPDLYLRSSGGGIRISPR